MSYNASSPTPSFSKHTKFFGIKLWLLILIVVALILFLILVFLTLCFLYLCRTRKPNRPRFKFSNHHIACTNNLRHNSSSIDRRLLHCTNNSTSEVEVSIARPEMEVILDMWSAEASDSTSQQSSADVVCRGNRFSLKEIEVVTNGFSDANLVGEGYYGVVYRGVLLDATRVAVKKLHPQSSCQGQEFIAQVEAIGFVKHRNLVKLLGYCEEGANRLLVDEYVDNGNLHDWLHSYQGEVSPLTWNIRMNIIQGIAKGLAYLHEDIEPKMVHHILKSNNILLDQQWNPKISDFGIVKLLSPDWSHMPAYLMGSLGYLAQEYVTSKCPSEDTDVYSFGVLIMEMISGRTPVDHDQPQVYLVDWLKGMVASKKIMYITDPKLAEKPCSKELKRILLIAFRCVDPDVENRPRMGQVIHMLEPRDLLLSDERRFRRNTCGHSREDLE